MFHPGEILYICRKDNPSDFVVREFISMERGPRVTEGYETTILCKNPVTGIQLSYGEDTYSWIPIDKYIITLYDVIKSAIGEIFYRL